MQGIFCSTHFNCVQNLEYLRFYNYTNSSILAFFSLVVMTLSKITAARNQNKCG